MQCHAGKCSKMWALVSFIGRWTVVRLKRSNYSAALHIARWHHHYLSRCCFVFALNFHVYQFHAATENCNHRFDYSLCLLFWVVGIKMWNWRLLESIWVLLCNVHVYTIRHWKYGLCKQTDSSHCRQTKRVPTNSGIITSKAHVVHWTTHSA